MTNYGCWNKPRPTERSTHLGQDGYEGAVSLGWDTFAREPVYVEIKSAFGSTECKCTQRHASDPQCAGCAHRANPQEQTERTA